MTYATAPRHRHAACGWLADSLAPTETPLVCPTRNESPLRLSGDGGPRPPDLKAPGVGDRGSVSIEGSARWAGILVAPEPVMHRVLRAGLINSSRGVGFVQLLVLIAASVGVIAVVHAISFVHRVAAARGNIDAESELRPQRDATERRRRRSDHEACLSSSPILLAVTKPTRDAEAPASPLEFPAASRSPPGGIA